ncbi:MAG: DUF1330 domain-containing protein [Acidobacteria bacterium]|nr:DUF1330 domain-containing protein [Acidobacteriota bacterium]
MSDGAKGYWIVNAVVTDPVAFGPYTEAAGPVIRAAGGRPVIHGAVTEVVEGAPTGRPFIIEFPSFEVALACYRSPEYQAAIALREGAATFDITVAEGAEPLAGG